LGRQVNTCEFGGLCCCGGCPVLLPWVRAVLEQEGGRLWIYRSDADGSEVLLLVVVRNVHALCGGMFLLELQSPFVLIVAEKERSKTSLLLFFSYTLAGLPSGKLGGLLTGVKLLYENKTQPSDN
jgi:hypothetical protein